MAQCSSGLNTRNACEAYQYCTWNNGPSLMGTPPSTQCDPGAKDHKTGETGPGGKDSMLSAGG